MSDDDGGGNGEGGEDPIEKVAGGATGALGGLADLVGDGAETHDAHEALESAGEASESVEDVAKTASNVREAARALESGNVGDGARGIGGALGNASGAVGAVTSAIAGVVPEGEGRRAFQDASRVAGGVGKIARGVGQLVDGAADLLGDLLEQRTEVQSHLQVDGEDLEWHVRSASFFDAIGALTECTVEAVVELDAAPDEEELLGKDAHLTFERGDQQRSIRGIVQHAHVMPQNEHTSVRLHIVPAAWMLSQTVDSRIYQAITVPDLVEQIIHEFLGSRHRSVRKDLTETYNAHEYLVQHRESHWQFITRLCDEEGIFFYFDHDQDEHETLVLADSNDNRPLVREIDDGRIHYEHGEGRTSGRDVAYAVDRRRALGATDAVVRGFDWTNPSLRVQQDRTGRGAGNGPPMEVYDHDHSVRYHEYDDGGGSYRSHTADRRSQLQTERLDIARQHRAVHTTVVTARPAHVFELVGTDDHDDRYLIVSVSGSLTAGEHGGEIDNTLDVIPVDMPYRPPAPMRRSMPGPETATVVGPAGEEIHTDRHGRIKVQFHWDRRGQNDEHSSAWIRVSQAWAGPGWGFVFIPRIGVEVIVSFLGGDPDRPIVTGCVYNGSNAPPYALPDEKTKSTIKTNSSLGGGGSNELRFEDKSGSEEVYIHAQKDFSEVVEHSHSTHVKNDQTNTVDHDQTETVGHDQKLHVKNDRTKNVDANEKTEIGGNRMEEVTGHEQIHVHQWRKVKIEEDEKLVVHGNREMHVDGKDKEVVVDGRDVTISGFDNLHVVAGANRNEEISGQKNTTVTKKYALVQGGSEKLIMDGKKTHLESGKEIELKTGASDYVLKDDGNVKLTAASKVEIEVGGSKIEITTTSIKLTAGPSSIELSSSGVTVSGPKITSSAQGVQEITGLLVKIN